MNLQQITATVDAGDPVYWLTRNYHVVKSPAGDGYLVCHDKGGTCRPLTGPDGRTLQFNECDFAPR